MNRLRRAVAYWIAIGVLLCTVPALSQPPASPKPASPHLSKTPQSKQLSAADMDQNLDAKIPEDLQFRNSRGEPVRLGQILDGQRPVVLAFGYVSCPNLCTLVHESMVDSLRDISLRIGPDIQVLSVSIDPDEPIDLTRSSRERYLQMYGGPNEPQGESKNGRRSAGEGWHSLVGDKQTIRALADTVGFHYAYDAQRDEYAHPGVLVILTPEGRVSRYFFGVGFAPENLKLSLLEASKGSIGSPVDKILLRCFRFDEESGAYTFAIMRMVRVMGAVTVMLLALGFFFISRRAKSAGEV